MKSLSVDISARDGRCRHWAKVVRAAVPLPLSSICTLAHDIPGPVVRLGDGELAPGDALLEREANHHRRTDRGWFYRVSVVSNGGERFKVAPREFGDLRKRMKAVGLPIELPMSSEEIGAMVRDAHAARSGILSTAMDGVVQAVAFDYPESNEADCANRREGSGA
jgi:hypothetical protein